MAWIPRRRSAPPPPPKTLLIEDLTLELVRKRMKTVRISIHPPEGRVRISAPLRAPEAFILQFLKSNLDWIRARRDQMRMLPPPPPAMTEEEAGRLRPLLHAALPEIFSRWERVLGVKADFIGIKRMKSRWGSCNVRERRIWINLELARHPKELLEYVVVHELAHLIEASHNARFKRVLDAAMPEWRVRDRALQKLGRPV